MRILLHDYPGHAFPVQLARELARRGHRVHHLYAAFFQAPKGALERRPDDAPGFHVEGLSLGRAFAKYSFPRRLCQEIAYGRRLAARMEEIAPEIVFSGNAPLDPQAILQARARRAGLPFVFWLQDLYGVAIDRILRQRLPVAGGAIGGRFLRLERRLLRASDAVVGITDDFLPTLARWGVARDRIEIIENWAPLEGMPMRPRRNAWSRAHGLDDGLCLLYAGSMGLKHDPALVLGLAERYAARPEIRVVVVSEGRGADWLEQHRRAAPGNLTVLPFQPVAEMADVLASADILLAVLEPDAGAFSVPSKILNYLCAGRPVLAAIPPQNLAARILARSGAGEVVAPGDAAALYRAADGLIADADRRARMGRSARAWAEAHFPIEAIGDRFERLLLRVAGG